MTQTRILAIGGGEMKTHETLKIDEYIAAEAKKIAGDRRACGLFLPTASHDCMPYYNTFHKVYTGMFDVKTDVMLLCNREPNLAKWQGKIDKADFLYIGGGDTVFMIDEWKRTGLLELLRGAYEKGKFVCGLSAGAICWFEDMYSDSVVEGDYAMYRGLGWIKGKISPHYNERTVDFDKILVYNQWCAWGVENDAALEIVNGEPVKSVSGSGKVFRLDATNGELLKTEF